MSKKDWKLLQAYKATGLTPAEIMALTQPATSAEVKCCATCNWRNKSISGSPCGKCWRLDHWAKDESTEQKAG